jgi:hypothetical protein
VHISASHFIAVHERDAQSEATAQPRPWEHGPHPASPPQSTSVSWPFFARSEQVAAAQVPASAQMLEAQSDPRRHLSPSAQPAHPASPPQSRSLSPPFFAPSVQLGAEQKPASPQTVDLQSKPTRHLSPSAHARQPPSPPQSRSVSAPFFAPSVQVAATQQPPTQRWL